MLYLFGLILKCQDSGNGYQDFNVIVAENIKEARRRAEEIILKRGPGRLSVDDIWRIDQVDGHQIEVR